jgi:hypothetical protein
MRESLRDIVRRVLSGSILVTGAATPAAAAVVVDHPTVELPPPAAELSAAADVGVMVLREARPRLVLKRAAESTLTLVSSHRSHRSHSSHRSHYSSSGGRGGGYRRSYPRTTTPSRRSEPLPVTGAYCVPVDVEFGSRLLQRGMCGSDVAELMRLLVAHGHLASYDVNSDSMFTFAVENAVREFQRSRQLDRDGKVGPVTSRHLRREP